MNTLRITIFIICLFFMFSCVEKPEIEVPFNKTQWAIKTGKDYPHRNSMLNNVIYNDTIRTLTKQNILSLLGNPDRTNENYVYYMIDQKRLGFWPLHSRFLVFKFKDENTIEWIKTHE